MYNFWEMNRVQIIAEVLFEWLRQFLAFNLMFYAISLLPVIVYHFFHANMSSLAFISEKKKERVIYVLNCQIILYSR